MSQFLFQDTEALKQRPLSELYADKAAVHAIVQGAVNVELFTIPLYMSSLYSIEGKHQINAQDNNFYQGRWWPGMGITPKKPSDLTPNQDAFNKVFGVFVAEMLHLQMASNIAVAVGLNPNFTSPALQNGNHGWVCYGAGKTIIPHIVDLADFKDTPTEKNPYAGVEVNIGTLNAKQVELFLAIEETDAVAEKFIPQEVWDSKYTHSIPFANWTKDSTENDLPMFGTIGRMYLALWEYLSIQYEDGQTLWEKMYVQNSLQRDLFNAISPKKKPQYPSMNTMIAENATAEDALEQVLDMIDGITDQGEGKEAIDRIRLRLNLPAPRAVMDRYQPSEPNLTYDYPTYNDKGNQEPVSAQAASRGGINGAMDHYEIFTEVGEIIKKEGFKTWDMWHAEGNRWQASDLITNEADYEENRKNYPDLPTAEEIAQALNNLKYNDHDKNYTILSQASVGSLYGMTSVLNDFWSKASVGFPSPAMGGTGDRMSICWAIFGQVPDLSIGVPAKDSSVLYHACQGMNLDPSQPYDAENCANVAIYHTCIGSNDCRSQGGCGFVQSLKGGGSCSSSGGGGGSCNTKTKVLCGGPTPSTDLYSAPSDNKCGGFGGCAVPISASQMFPTKGKMQLFDFKFGVMSLLPCPVKPYEIEHHVVNLNEGQLKIIGWQAIEMTGVTYPYTEGESVYEVAWTAYTKVLETQGKEVPPKPKPSDLRIAFPPST